MRGIFDGTRIATIDGLIISRIEKPIRISGHEVVGEAFSIRVGVRKVCEWRMDEDGIFVVGCRVHGGKSSDGETGARCCASDLRFPLRVRGLGIVRVGLESVHDGGRDGGGL